MPTDEEGTLTTDEMVEQEMERLRQVIYHELQVGNMQLQAGMEGKDVIEAAAVTEKGAVNYTLIQIKNRIDEVEKQTGFSEPVRRELRQLFLRMYLLLTANSGIKDLWYADTSDEA